MIYLKIYLIAWFIAQFEPVQDLFDYLFKKLPDNYITDMLYTAVGCTKCLTLWLTLIITQSVWWALGMSLLAHVQKQILENANS